MNLDDELDNKKPVWKSIKNKKIERKKEKKIFHDWLRKKYTKTIHPFIIYSPIVPVYWLRILKKLKKSSVCHC